jgi:hypothetical protein
MAKLGEKWSARKMAAGNTEEALTITETRSRAKNTGHAFFFRGNLGLPFMISVMVSVILVTVLLGSGPVALKFAEGFMPAILTTLYLVICRVGKPPRWDIDWIRTFALGRGFMPARVQPLHPMRVPVEAISDSLRGAR